MGGREEERSQQQQEECCGGPYRDGGLHVAVFTGVVGSVPQQSELALFRYQPAGQLCIPAPRESRRDQVNNTHVWLEG